MVQEEVALLDTFLHSADGLYTIAVDVLLPIRFEELVLKIIEFVQLSLVGVEVFVKHVLQLQMILQFGLQPLILHFLSLFIILHHLYCRISTGLFLAICHPLFITSIAILILSSIAHVRCRIAAGIQVELEAELVLLLVQVVALLLILPLFQPYLLDYFFLDHGLDQVEVVVDCVLDLVNTISETVEVSLDLARGHFACVADLFKYFCKLSPLLICFFHFVGFISLAFHQQEVLVVICFDIEKYSNVIQFLECFGIEFLEVYDS